ncbi:histone acetyltransferase of the CBP family 1 [Actinidia rufa]|uniref:histone acetyltransferase n=1 Tax=Actinidia rufa TaxID=165716 RepID=A0A7J0FEC9_9ERIC|nr:histone acetyltransferase of the CBP family 1 [Actinidia rufa]
MTSEEKCPEVNCTTAQKLWTHIVHCNISQCPYPRCHHTKLLLNHQRHCRDADCFVCVPVEHYIQRQLKASHACVRSDCSLDLPCSINGSCEVLDTGVIAVRLVSETSPPVVETSEDLDPLLKRRKAERPDISDMEKGNLDNNYREKTAMKTVISDDPDQQECIQSENDTDRAKQEDITLPAESVPGTNSGKPKIRGVSMTELFTPEKVREHIMGLRKSVGQSKSKAEKNQAMEHSMSENSCRLCAFEKLTFEPPPARLGKNDEKSEEGWVQWDKCEAWQHQICALFNGGRNDGGQAEYTCPNCYITEIEKGGRKPLPQSAVLGAKDQPRTILSDHIEQQLFRRLKKERQERARVRGKSCDEVPGAVALVVRVVSSVDKKLAVKQRFLEIFQEENYPEFGSECQQPNHRRVYLSYLDSIKYFQPEVKAVTGEALRTFVYHEILIGRKQHKKGTTTKTVTKRGLKLSGQSDLSGNASKDLLLMLKIGETICPMKEDFIMVHLQHACTPCCILIVSGNHWVCNECEKFQLCDKCYETEQKLEERDQHPINQMDKHLLYLVEINDVPEDTEDKNEILESQLFDTRQAFLSLCQANHYQYDTIRRAKHSSMMVLYHLHNPAAPHL